MYKLTGSVANGIEIAAGSSAASQAATATQSTASGRKLMPGVSAGRRARSTPRRKWAGGGPGPVGSAASGWSR